jgi:hypothetical protein
MPDAVAIRRNVDAWRAFLFALAALLCNAIFFLNPPAQRVVPWLSLGLTLAAMIFLVRGLRRAFGQPRVYGSKVSTSILAALALIAAGLSTFTFFQAHALPVSAGAPRVGQTVPDFALADTSNRPTTLSQLFAPAKDSPPHKALLLIFYRGYW